MQENGRKNKAENVTENKPEMVSRAEYERLKLEMTAERLLAEAGARSLPAAMALLNWSVLDFQAEDWVERLRQQIRELRRRSDTAFLFAPERQEQDYHWLGLQPQAPGDMIDVYGADGAFGLRLAQAEGVEAIKIKQEAAAQGIIL